MSLTAEIVSRRPLESAGNSGNVIEHVTLRDGRELVLKRVSPEWDWMSRVTHDRGRLGFNVGQRALRAGAGGDRSRDGLGGDGGQRMECLHA